LLAGQQIRVLTASLARAGLNDALDRSVALLGGGASSSFPTPNLHGVHGAHMKRQLLATAPQLLRRDMQVKRRPLMEHSSAPQPDDELVPIRVAHPCFPRGYDKPMRSPAGVVGPGLRVHIVGTAGSSDESNLCKAHVQMLLSQPTLTCKSHEACGARPPAASAACL
jgi:hypothetical protein